MRLDRLALLPVLALLAVSTSLAACTSAPGTTPGPSGGGTPAPSGTPTGDAIDHATGARDVILRMDEGGGFVPPGFFVTQGPLFTLYGDGTVIWRDPKDPLPADTGKGVPGVPYRTARLDEAGIQALLRFAAADGGLGIAKLRYDPGNIADAPSTTFTFAAGGVEKRVEVVALAMDSYGQSPDRFVVAQLAALRDRLMGFSGTVSGAPWVPDRYRGILADDGFAAATLWPWPGVKPSDFVAPDANTFGRWRTMTPVEAKALGIPGFIGGVRDAALRASDGKVYGFSLRPLWPDEAR